MANGRRRRVVTAAESGEIWDRWQRGEGLRLIGRAFGKTSSQIFAHLKPHGGIRPVRRRRSRRVLSLDEREEISRGIAAGVSLRSIAADLHRARSTISRELKRNGGHGRYRAAAADKRAWRQAMRPKSCKLANHDHLRQLVAAKLEANWSPEQIAGWLKRTYPDDEAYQVSHETIYRSLFVQARGVLKKELQAHLRSGRAIPSLAARHRQERWPREHRRCDLDPRASGFGGGSRRSRSLGRRPAVRVGEQLHRHPGRAALALRTAGQGC